MNEHFLGEGFEEILLALGLFLGTWEVDTVFTYG